MKIDVSTLSAEKRAAIEARRAYQREWRAKNRDKIRASEERFWLKKAALNGITEYLHSFAVENGVKYD